MPLHFHNEDHVRAELSQRLARHFGYARRLLSYWLQADKDRVLARSKLPTVVRDVPVMMSVKACRQFRSVIELCERGEAVDGSIIARSMFETALVVGFVLKPRFVPRKFD